VSIVSARNLSKAYGPQTLFSQIALTVGSGDRVGLLGANGAGKSTLLRVLAGKESADEGTIDRRRDARILYLPQEPVLDESSTPRQLVEQGLSAWHEAKQRYESITRALGTDSSNAALLAEQAKLAETIEHLGGWTRDHVALQMLDHLGVRDIDRTVSTMSGGERRRVALAQLLVAEPDLAILDEPTNHLDTETIEWLEAYLADEFAGAVLMVTHDRYVLDAVADRILELDRGAVLEFEGGYTEYLDRKAELAEHAERVEKNRLNLIRRERAWLMRGARARSTKQKARLARAKAVVGSKAPDETARASFAGLEQAAERTGKTILDLELVSLELGEKKLIESLTLRMVGGERIGVVGPNGAGKTSLLEVVTGELSPTKGSVVRGANTRFVHFDQSRSQLRDDWSVTENVAEREGAERSGGGVVMIGERSVDMTVYLEQFLFDRSKQRQKVASLSGGERARVALAKALRTGANLLLLDEPTNDLDIATLGALEELLETWPGCALVVSHDRYFLDRIATSILAFEGDGKVTRYPGGYESYRSLRPRPESGTIAPEPGRAALAPTAPPKVDAPKPLTFAERKELETILDEISALETEQKTLESRLSDPTLYAQGADEAQRVRADHARIAISLAERTERWEALESRREVKRR
jgi:ATP-binding cassette subfamily F protein uup